jgi:hypothetical protein
MASAKRVTGVQRQQQGGWHKGHGSWRCHWREGDDCGNGDGDGARDMAACATTGEGGIMVATGHGFCVCFFVSVENTQDKEESKIMNVS